LNLIDHDEPAEIREGQPGIIEPVQVRRIFEVEVVDGRQIWSPLGNVGSRQGHLPALTGPSPVLAGVRMLRIAGFDNYLIFYCPTENGIDIIRVLHAKRDIDALFGGRG